MPITSLSRLQRLSVAGRRVVRTAITIVLCPIALILYFCGIRFLHVVLLNTRIGHLAYEPDMYLKADLLGWCPKYRAVLLARKNIVNPCLLEYWRAHVKVIDNPLLIILLRPFSVIWFLKARYAFLPDGRRMDESQNEAFLAIQRAYEQDRGGRPLLTLTPGHREEGWRALNSLGLRRDDWFVCLHVREPGYRPRGAVFHSARDADVNTYIPAIKRIVERGGWVIRMGDPTMKKPPPLDHVIDYAHHPVRSDWMDVFLCAQCKFFLGTTSGLFLVAFVFGVPCAQTNYTPLPEAPFSGRDLYLPKLLYCEVTQRLLGFEEVFSRNLADAVDSAWFRSSKVTLINNSPEDIVALADEMCDALDGTLHRTPDDDRLQQEFRQILAAHGRQVPAARVGRDFLRKYSPLLSGSMSVAFTSSEERVRLSP